MDDLDLDLDELGSALPEPDTLSTRILDSLCPGTSSLESSGDSVRYLTEGNISRVITTNDIFQELQRCDRHRVLVSRRKECNPCTNAYLNDFSDWIHHHARKVFAITLYCALDEADTILAMKQFRVYEFGDDKLPVRESVISDYTLKEFHARIWTPVRRRRFYDDQWKFVVPVFTREKYDYDLNPNDIFPFTVESSTLPKVGGFGAVYKVRFHEEHQEDTRMLTVSFSD